jgi:hypothetical protein
MLSNRAEGGKMLRPVRSPLDPSAAPIGVLFGLSRPPAVARLVVPGVVDTVDGSSFGSIAHVSVEVLELQPPLAHCDASASIVGIGGVPRVEAARHHPLPRVVGSGVLGPNPRPEGRAREGVLHLLTCRFGDGLLRFARVMLPLHRMGDLRVVAGHVLADAVSALVHGRVFTAAARAELRLKRRPVLLMPLRLGDLTSGLFGVVAAFFHIRILYQPRGESN